MTQVIDWIHWAAEHYPESIALEELETGHQRTYADLDARAGRLAWMLKEPYACSRGPPDTAVAELGCAH